MSVEMRGFETDRGTLIPYFVVNFTVSQLEAFAGNEIEDKALYVYNNPAPVFDIMPNPPLEDLRAIVDEVCAGGNVGAYLGLQSGTYRFINQDGSTASENAITASLSTMETRTNSMGSYNRVSGTVTPAAWVSTTGISGGFSTSFSPVPKIGEYTDTLRRFYRPQAVILTSDGYLRYLDIDISTNIYGAQTMTYWGIAGPTAWNNIWPDYKSVHIKDLNDNDDDDGDDDMARFNPRAATSTIGIYGMTVDSISSFMEDIWTTDLLESFRAAFVGDGSDAILGLRWFYGLNAHVDWDTGGSVHPVIGNVPVNQATAIRANSEYVKYEFGSIAVPSYFGDYRDWTEVSYKMYLPFIGIIDLNPADIIGKQLWLTYRINITDGSAVCRLASDNSEWGGNGTLYIGSCSWGYDIPVKADSTRDAVSLGVSAGIGALAGVGLGSVGGPGGSAFGALAGAATSVAGSAGSAPSYEGGSLAPNSNVMSDLEAKLVCYHHTDLTEDLTEAAGQPSAATLEVGEVNGYLKADVVYNGGSLAMRRSGEIISMLQEGIYL